MLKKRMFLSFFFFIYWPHWSTGYYGSLEHWDSKGQSFFLLNGHFALSYVMRKKLRQGSLFWLTYQNAKQKRLGAWGGRLQRGSLTDGTIKSFPFMMLSSQGKEVVCCHCHRETLQWLLSGERSVTCVSTRSN